MEQPQKIAGLGRDEAAVLFIVGVMRKLDAHGLIEGFAFQVSTDGEKALREMERIGFAPTTDEMKAATLVLSEWAKK